MRNEIIERALGEGAAETADAATVARATSHAVGQLLAELQPLVGALAAQALYARSIHLARSSFQRSEPGESDVQSLLAPLRENLAARSPAEAGRAGRALLLAFIDLLASLIGTTLTLRILNTAWGMQPAPLPFHEEPQ